MVSGLKVNFAKSNVVGINIEGTSLRGISHFLACNIGSVPFKFIGVPVGSNPRRVSTWQPIIDAIKARLNFSLVWWLRSISEDLAKGICMDRPGFGDA